MERMYYIWNYKYSICSFVHEIEDWQEGFKVSAIGCIVGLLLNCFAAVLYVFNVLSSILGIFSVFTK